MKKTIYTFVVLAVISGCASAVDAPKNIIGISTKDMDDSRNRSIFQSYDCTLLDCYTSVWELAEKNKYHVFMKDEIRGLIVLMSIPGAVDTTEVGVFLTRLPNNKGTRVELSSRSSAAKRTVALAVFGELAQKFKKF